MLDSYENSPDNQIFFYAFGANRVFKETPSPYLFYQLIDTCQLHLV